MFFLSSASFLFSCPFNYFRLIPGKLSLRPVVLSGLGDNTGCTVFWECHKQKGFFLNLAFEITKKAQEGGGGWTPVCLGNLRRS